ncbi:hypothetical protein [Ottowia sp.]|uniref:hypothetical protein n=1 Tax=Ottowia sp. TaxID=1898956 RepID=UPI003A84AE6B
MTAKRLGVTKSQFIVSALERALGRKNPYELLLKIKAQEHVVREPSVSIGSQLSPAKAAIRAKLKAKHEASQADWLAYQEARRRGQTWPGPEQEAGDS